MADKKKAQAITKKFRIAVVGPSYVGKTQIVNRYVNNSFTGYYEPTLEPNVFRRAYHFNEDDPNEKPIFVDLEIVDMFPHDHPFMDEEDATASEASRAMTAHLQQVLNVPYEKQVAAPKISWK